MISIRCRDSKAKRHVGAEPNPDLWLLATSRPTNPDLPNLHERSFISTMGLKGQVLREAFASPNPAPSRTLRTRLAPTKNDLSQLIQSIAPTNHDLWANRSQHTPINHDLTSSRKREQDQ